MCPPDFYGIEYEINPWMSRAAAQRSGGGGEQWAALARVVAKQAGAKVSLRDAGRGLARPGVHGQRGADFSADGRDRLAFPPSRASEGRAARCGLARRPRFPGRACCRTACFSKGPAMPCSAATRCLPAIAFAAMPAGISRLASMLGCACHPAGAGRSVLLPPGHVLLPAGAGRGHLLPGGVRRTTAATCSGNWFRS